LGSELLALQLAHCRDRLEMLNISYGYAVGHRPSTKPHLIARLRLAHNNESKARSSFSY
jgi:hypothetical protein